METKNIASPVLQPAKVRKQDRLSLWLQFPRRLIMLLVAFALGVLVFLLLRGVVETIVGDDEFDWGVSLANHQPINEIILERLPSTFLLLAITYGISLLISLITTTIAFFVHGLETRSSGGGFLLNRLGRLWIFCDIALPSFILGLLLIWIFAFRLEVLPQAGRLSPGGVGDLPDRIRHLILPVAALVFMPAGLAAQAAARRMHYSSQKGFRLWLAGILRLLAGLFRQIGGVLAAILLTEAVFAWPGIGRLTFEAAARRDFPLFLGCVASFAALVLVGRIFAELFDWLARFASPEPVTPPEAEPRLKKRRKNWLIFIFILLTILLVWIICGVSVSQNAVNEVSMVERLTQPSVDHWLGTDEMGRDMLARLAHGTAVTFGAAGIAAVLALLLAFPTGLLAGWLSRKQKWWADLLADLTLLPADISLFLPAVMAGILLLVIRQATPLSGQNSTWMLVGILAAILILPRSTRVMAQLWTDAPDGKVLKRTGITLAVLLLSGLFIGSVVVSSLDFLGFGVQPPVPSLGGMLLTGAKYIGPSNGLTLMAGLVLWFLLWVFYLAADALLEDWPGKDALSWLNS